MAQLVERLTLDQQIRGSTPRAPANFPFRVAETYTMFSSLESPNEQLRGEKKETTWHSIRNSSK